ncbi:MULTISPECIES: amino-acid N-acetyltransferase [Methylophaga]|uniref:Amino-acid acetyltransferase n=1 Tax=Methylophaga aminisulfidivorans MP TaxID=1026882 RepID=F5SXY0_9GAMM|nr:MULTISPECIES: amino-acid N-acetyltransferase [Methylophaga]EGL54048.1 acetylglutamate kinase [Methylophaga aminisulfidivorans MP]WVI85242.1 amino-acid N-acetyltransferase [Methylophaga thalassica]
MNDTVKPVTPQNLATTTSWFRTAAPYIHSHRGATFVIAFDGETIDSQEFEPLLHDISILNSLGIKLVLVYGARPQIEASCIQQNVPVRYHSGLRVTDDVSLVIAKAAIGKLRLDIESKLSFGLPHTPMADARIRCISGNLVIARPAGIIDGVDLGHTGEVRRIDSEGINQQLAAGNIVLLPPLGYSLTGESFNVSAESIATEVATALRADKLIFIGHSNKTMPRELTVDEAQKTLSSHPSLPAAVKACKAGVTRVHILDRAINGVLLQELFSRDGAGTLVTATSFETTRQAVIDDVGGILELLQPLEEKGIVVKRSRELLEREIDHFTVMERDGSVVACAALYPYPENDMAELACLAVSNHYQSHGRGKQLLAVLEQSAQAQGINHLCVLTTQTAHWFLEQGFKPAEIADLPVAKQALYNYHRNSRVFRKQLA